MRILKVLVRLVVLPVKLAFEVVGVAFRTGRVVGRVPMRAGVEVQRRIGWRGILLLKLGVVMGLLLAPMSGRELRARLARIAGAGGGTGGAQLQERVVFELAHAPRTWHLPQPTVEVAGSDVTLRGEVPHADGREELVATAGAVPGVRAVHDELTVVAADA